MIKRILLWLISIYFKPATTETKTPEVETMSEPLVDAQADQADQIAGIDGVMNAQPAVINITNVAPSAASPAAEVKAGVADFEAALTFVESGISQLGEAAKDELKELAKKYL
ncbi:hypothetical protein [Ewingella americana]